MLKELANNRNISQNRHLGNNLAFVAIHQTANSHSLTIRHRQHGGSLAGNQSRYLACTGRNGNTGIYTANLSLNLRGYFAFLIHLRLNLQLNTIWFPLNGNLSVLAGRDRQLATNENFRFFTAHGGNIWSGQNLYLVLTGQSLNHKIYILKGMMGIILPIHAAIKITSCAKGNLRDSTI